MFDSKLALTLLPWKLKILVSRKLLGHSTCGEALSFPLDGVLLGDVTPLFAGVPLVPLVPGLTAAVLGFLVVDLATLPLPAGFCVVDFRAVFVTGPGFFGGMVVFNYGFG